MIDFSMHLSALVLERGLASSQGNRILVLRKNGSSDYMLPVEDLSDDECEVETLDRTLREMCSMRLTAKLGKIGRRLVRISEDRVSTTEVFLCHAYGTPEYRKGEFEALWVEPQVLLKNSQKSERFGIIFRNAAALCATPFLEAKPHDVRKLPDCCRSVVSSSAGIRLSQDIVLCGEGHLVQCDESLRAWAIPKPQATVETVRG